MEKKIITIDCDGVVVEKLWGRNWSNQKKNNPFKNKPWYKWFYRWWAGINYNWRKPVAGVRENLIRLKNLGYKLILVTSREEYLRELTDKWLRQNKLREFFDELEFNGYGTTAAESKVRNLKKIKPLGHVDDNKETVDILAKKYPELKLLWLNPPALRAPSLEEGRAKMSNLIMVESWEEIIDELA